MARRLWPTGRTPPLVAVALLFAALAQPAAAASDHVVVSAVQVSGETTTDEFVELVNPTAAGVDLAGWRLSRRTSSGRQTNLLTALPAVTLAPGVRYRITHPTGYRGAAAPNATYSTAESLAPDNTIVLFSDAGRTVVDLVGFGTASSFEGAAAPNPAPRERLERRASDGVAVDTDNNRNDFALLPAPAAGSPDEAGASEGAPLAPVEPVASEAATPALRRGPVTVTGVVSAPPGTIGDDLLYLTGLATTGVPANLRVDLPGAPSSSPALGDRLRITGTLHTVQGERRLEVTDVEAVVNLGPSGLALEPTPLVDVDLERDLGRLVSERGTAQRRISGGFSLARADNGTIRVLLPPSMERRFPYAVPSEVAVTAIVSRTSAGPRLLVRTPADLALTSSPLERVSAPPVLPPPDVAPWLITGLGAFGLTLALGYRYAQARARRKASAADDEGADVIVEDEFKE